VRGCGWSERDCGRSIVARIACSRLFSSAAYSLQGKRNALLSQEGSTIEKNRRSWEGRFQSRMSARFAWEPFPRATLPGRAALLTQEGVTRLQIAFYFQKPSAEGEAPSFLSYRCLCRPGHMGR